MTQALEIEAQTVHDRDDGSSPARFRLGVHSEYGKLKTAVVGNPDDLALPPFGKDLAHYNAELRSALERSGGAALSIRDAFPERWEKAAEQIEAVVETYRANGVEVHRLRPYSDAERGYLGHLQAGRSQLYPADPVFMLGEHFLELNVRRAYRRKEIFPIRDAVRPLIEDDPAARWVAMPTATPFDPSGEGPGPYLEGGDILILGKDVLVGESHLSSNREGADWLRRYLDPYGYTVHSMPLVGNLLHSLSVMCLLREGLMLAYPPAFADGLPAPLADWEVIEITEDEAAGFATVGISLDPSRYLIDPRHTRIMDELDRRGVEPVPTPCDQVYFWGGAIRCITLPLARE